MTGNSERSQAPATSKKIAHELFDACNAFKEDSKQWQRIAVAIQAAEGEIERLTRENATLRSVCKLWGLNEDPEHEANVAKRSAHETPARRSLQQQVMSFISAGVNTGLWNRDIAYDLVRQMLNARWNEASPRGKPCTCDNALGSSCACRVDAGERLGDLWYCRKRAESAEKACGEPLLDGGPDT